MAMIALYSILRLFRPFIGPRTKSAATNPARTTVLYSFKGNGVFMSVWIPHSTCIIQNRNHK